MGILEWGIFCGVVAFVLLFSAYMVADQISEGNKLTVRGLEQQKQNHVNFLENQKARDKVFQEAFNHARVLMCEAVEENVSNINLAITPKTKGRKNATANT